MANTAQFKITGISNDTGIAGDGITNDTSLMISGAAATNGGSVRVYLNDELIGTFNAPAQGAAWKFDYTNSVIQDGTYVIKAVDVTSGATATYNIKVDTRIATPVIALVTDSGAAGDFITNNAALAVTGLEAGATVLYSPDGTIWSAIQPVATEGLNKVYVKQTDLAGNSATSSIQFTLDTSAAAPTVALANDTGASGSDKVTNIADLAISGIETNAVVEFSADGVTWGANEPTAVQGQNTVFVRQTDVAGNTSAATEFTFTLDTEIAKPAISLSNDTGSSNSDSLTNDATVLVTELEEGATVEYSADGDHWSATQPDATEGVNVLYVRQTDLAGNTATSSITFTLDTQVDAPAVALSVDSGIAGDKITNDATLNVTSEEGAKLEYRTVGGEWSVTAPTPDEGANTFEVRQIDAAGNVSDATTIEFVLDTQVDAPVLSLTNDTGVSGSDGITKDATLTLNGVEDGATVEYSVDGEEWTSTLPTFVDGLVKVYARQTDIAGNHSDPSIVEFTLDTQVSTPSIALVNDSGLDDDGITNNGTFLVSGTEVDATVEYSIDGTTWTTSLPTATEGANSISVRQTDLAGNVSAASLVKFILDTQAPTAPVVTLSNDTGSSSTDNISKVGTLNVSGLEAGAKVEYSVDGGASWTNSFSATEGGNSVDVRQSDVAGNTSVLGHLNFVLDTTAQSPKIANAQLNGKSSTVTLSGTAEAGSLVSVFDFTANKAVGTVVADANGGWSLTSAKVTGIHNFGISMTDLAGNAASGSIKATVGTMNAETINDVAGQNNILSGAQGIDKFVFGANFGNDIITDFIAGNGTHEVIVFAKASFATIADILSHATQVGADSVIADSAGNTVTLIGVSIADLKAVDFMVV